MRARFSTSQVTTMVVAVAAAVVLAPVAVIAATGTIVNVTDGVNANRIARVNSSSELNVSQRAAVLPGSLNSSTNGGINQRRLLVQTVGPTRMAVTELDIATRGGAGSAMVHLISWYRTSGTGTCANVIAGTTTGFTSTLTRVLMIPVGETLMLDWSGPALTVPVGGVGEYSCLTATLMTAPTGTIAYYGTTYYTITA
jgi:hypothetical protein